MLTIEILKINRLMRTSSEVAAFEEALAALTGLSDESLLPALHLVLDDNCAHHEVMFGLVHFIETFQMSSQSRALLSVLPQLVKQAPEWAKILHFRILNDDLARECYRQLLLEKEWTSLDIAHDILLDIARNEDEPLKSAARSILSSRGN